MQLVDQVDLDQARDFLAGRPEHRPSVARGVMGWIIFIVLALLLFVVTRRVDSTGRPTGLEGSVLRILHNPRQASALIAALVSFFVSFYIWFALFRRLRRRSQILGPLRCAFTDQEITLERDGSELRWKWTAFEEARESRFHFLLRNVEGDWVIIPKRAITPPHLLDVLRAAVASRFPQSVFHRP